MRTHCPGCATVYEVDAQTLLAAGGLAHCVNCGTVYDAVGDRPCSEEDVARHGASRLLRLGTEYEVSARAPSSQELPFEVPDDLPQIKPSAKDALDIHDTLHERGLLRGLIYGLSALLLLLALSLQIAWQYRSHLLSRFPQLEGVCQYIACRPEFVHEPDSYQVMRRDIKPTKNEPGSLTLSAAIRNTAAFAQRLPEIQLSLIDNSGGVLVRRRLSPSDYLFPVAPDDRLVRPGEVFTIEIDFQDPGYIASGFMIDFY